MSLETEPPATLRSIAIELLPVAASIERQAADPGELPTLERAALLEDLCATPAYLTDGPTGQQHGHYSCSFCGVGDSGVVQAAPSAPQPPAETAASGEGVFRRAVAGGNVDYPAFLDGGRHLEVHVRTPIAAPGSVLTGTLVIGGESRTVVARETGLDRAPDGTVIAQTFTVAAPEVSVSTRAIKERRPTSGCAKLNLSMGLQQPVFPFHVAPSVLDHATGRRITISYQEAIGRLADLLLRHRPPTGRTLTYACGQIDYFAIFAMQEVLRLLGVRNLTGNAEHCLNAGAVHNEMLTGQEGPFLTIEQAVTVPNGFYLLNGWNGLITHPPTFHKLLQRKDLDAYLVEIAYTESAEALGMKLGDERILLVRSGSDPHLSLAIAHEILARYPEAVSRQFVERYADKETLERYAALAGSEEFAPENVVTRIAPAPAFEYRLLSAIRDIAAKLADPNVVPINIPSVGLSQTKGAVSHCLIGDLLALVGKYGLKVDGTPAGGTLRIPGQINAESEVQGLSRTKFMGRIPVTEGGAAEAATRMGLPADAYRMALEDTPRAALDYAEPTAEPELFLCFGTQFESNMVGRTRWIQKLVSSTLVVVDPIPDPFALEHAELIIPSPPHPAAAKLYQNGEWRLSLSIPFKRAPRETRTDATILYDAMAEVARRLRTDAELRTRHPDLARHVESGYLSERFESPEIGGGLRRDEGEVSRPQLWERVQAYMAGGSGPLYCRPEHADGQVVTWDDLLQKGNLVYGGVGTTRYRLDYDDPDHQPFRDVFRRPRKFTFFVPTERDLEMPKGIIMASGRSTLSDDKTAIRFAVSTFNSGKATPAVDMPAENPLHISRSLAERYGLKTGDRARVTGVANGEALVLPVVVTDRLAGDSTYVSFHKSRAELDEGRYLNTLTSHVGRCPYTSQTNLKATAIQIERDEPADESAPTQPTSKEPQP